MRAEDRSNQQALPRSQPGYRDRRTVQSGSRALREKTRAPPVLGETVSFAISSRTDAEAFGKSLAYGFNNVRRYSTEKFLTGGSQTVFRGERWGSAGVI